MEWFDVKTEEPKFCENIYKKDESKTLQINIEMALIHFQDRTAEAAIVSITEQKLLCNRIQSIALSSKKDPTFFNLYFSVQIFFRECVSYFSGV